MTKQILHLLEKDFIRNINLIYFIDQNPVIHHKIVGDSAAVIGRSDRDWVMLSSQNENELKELLQSIPIQYNCFAFAEDWMLPFISNRRKIEWRLYTDQYILSSNNPLPEKKFSTRSLNENDTRFIAENSDYKEYLSEEYISDRIKRAPSSGINIDGNLAAWIHTHDDYAIGSLHVMPDYRKKGIGESLLIDMIEKIKTEKKIPFGYIVPENTKSINLVSKLGFTKNKSISWLGLEK